MKELYLFTSAQSSNETVEQLGHLGVVDIKEITTTECTTISSYQKRIEAIDKAITILEKKREAAPRNFKSASFKSPQSLVDRVLKTINLRQKLLMSQEVINKQLSFYDTWGANIDSKSINDLKEKGVFLRLYELSKKDFKSLPKDMVIIAFTSKNKKIPVALFSLKASDNLGFDEVEIPDQSYSDLRKQLERKNRQLGLLNNFLQIQAQNLNVLKSYRGQMKDDMAIARTLKAMGDLDGRIKYLRGFIPEIALKNFKSTATKNDWGYALQDPKNPDEVPVFIKNPKWISIINPMMKFIDIVPGYKEVDVSIYFLIAFALFFAMLVGDAGYGLIFLIFTIIFRKKLQTQLRILIYVLSCSTILWGVFSGTYFGAQSMAELPVLKNLVISNIASFGVDNINFMMHLSFTIGAIHLTVAHLVKGFQYINSIKALSECGWVALVWGLYFVTEQLVLGIPAPIWYKWLFVVGASLVVFFSKESNSLWTSIAASIANLPLSLISGFSDIVSYVRLFAVGMATAAVAASFNQMALPEDVYGMGLLDLIMAAIALLLGHTLNIALALMAVMVHGIRLNMLEFAGHLGVQFSGEPYLPFKLKLAKDSKDKFE